MEKCYFNGCVLNDPIFYNKYKSQINKNSKMFSHIDLDEELMKISGVNTYAKKIYMCIEHIERYKKYKLLKSKLLSQEINQEVLIEINNLIKNDSDMRKLLLFIKELDIIILFFNNLGNKELRNLILINIYYLIKEVDLFKQYDNLDFHYAIISFTLENNIDIYKTNNANIDDLSIFLSLINILIMIYSFTNQKIDYQITSDLIYYLFDIISKIIDNDEIDSKMRKFKNSIDKEIVEFVKENQIYIFESIFGLVYSIIISKVNNLNISTLIVNFVIDNHLLLFKYINVLFVKHFFLVMYEVFEINFYTNIDNLHPGLIDLISMFEEYKNKDDILIIRIYEKIGVLKEKNQ